MSRPEHLGRKHHFDAETGESLRAKDGTQARLMNLLSSATPMPFRGYPAAFLSGLGIMGIPVDVLEAVLGSTAPAVGSWARELAQDALSISAFPITRGHRLVGVQLRPLPVGPKRIEPVKQFRTVGEGEGLFIPPFKGRNPVAVVVTEGPWDAVAIHADALDYYNRDIFAVAVLSAGVRSSTISSTLDPIFPGVPRFSLFDQDAAGVAARMATAKVATPILVTGVGDGKDYRELEPGLRFERLVDIVLHGLRELGV